MPTLKSIGVHPELRERLLTVEPAIETPQALLSRDPASLARALDAPLSQIETVRAAVADALAAKAPHGKRALRVAATVGTEEDDESIIVGAVSALNLCRYHEYLHGDRTAGISTHSRKLDELLAIAPEFKCASSGGLPFGYVTQVTGSPASGKTQLALQLAAEYAAQSGTVLYLASGFGHGTLLPLVRRLGHLCDKENFQTVLQNITFTTVHNGYEALAAIEQICDRNRVLLVFDSASGCLSADLYAAGDGDAGKALAQQVAYKLRRVARHNGAAVLVTNGTVSGDNGVKPALGQAWDAADASMWFQQDTTFTIASMGNVTTSDKRIRATLDYHSAKPCLPHTLNERTVEFLIKSAGLSDVPVEPGNAQP